MKISRILGTALVAAAIALVASSAMAKIGDQWILQIDHLDNSGAFTTQAGTGYSGPMSSGNAAFDGDSVLLTNSPGNDGTARVYWDLSGLSVNDGTPVPTTTELYTLEFYAPTDVGHNGFDPVESQFNGAAGETFPIDTDIPWAGQFGTNHQFIAADGFDDGLFHPLGLGPQAPASADFNAPGNGQYMWLTSGSWLYAKFDFSFPIDRSWSALRLTQATSNNGVPEPSTVLLTLVGCSGLALVVRRRRARAA